MTKTRKSEQNRTSDSTSVRARPATSYARPKSSDRGGSTFKAPCLHMASDGDPPRRWYLCLCAKTISFSALSHRESTPFGLSRKGRKCGKRNQVSGTRRQRVLRPFPSRNRPPISRRPFPARQGTRRPALALAEPAGVDEDRSLGVSRFGRRAVGAGTSSSRTPGASAPFAGRAPCRKTPTAPRVSASGP